MALHQNESNHVSITPSSERSPSNQDSTINPSHLPLQRVRFLYLPLEVRQMIYLACSGSEVYPSVNESRLRWNILSAKWMDISTQYVPTLCFIVTPGLVYDIALLNKQVHFEAMQSLHRDTVKCFTKLISLGEFVAHCTRLPNGHEYCHSIKLEFRHQEYLQFFQSGTAYIPNWYGGQTLYAKDLFPMMVDLGVQHLTLDFQSPNLPRNDRSLAHPFRGEAKHEMPGCSKVMVDWILRGAKKYILTIPEVSFTGYIKHSTRRTWETIIEKERHGEPQPNDLDSIRNLSRLEIPPECRCTNPCRSDGPGQISRNHLNALSGSEPMWSNEKRTEVINGFQFDFGD